LNTTHLEPVEAGAQGSLAQALGLSRDQAIAAWRAVRTVALADGEPGERSVRMLDVSARALGVLGDNGHDVPGIELSSAFSTPAMRRALVDALVIPACIEGEVTAPRETGEHASSLRQRAAQASLRKKVAALLETPSEPASSPTTAAAAAPAPTARRRG